MATKTVVCPECGSSAAPGRYACADCGALLAAVAATPRAYGAGPEPAPVAAPIAPEPATQPPFAPDPTTESPIAAAAQSPAAQPVAAVGSELEQPAASETPTSSGADGDTPVAPRTPRYLPSNGRPSRPRAGAEPPWIDVAAWDDEIGNASGLDAAAASAATAPGALALDDDTAVTPPDAVAPERAANVLDAAAPAVVAPLAAASLGATSPATWPPAGDRGPLPMPATRTPAGAYLPPSAVLDALDPAAAPGAADRGAARAKRSGASGGTARGLDLRRALGSLDLADDTPRAVIAVGAAIAAIGFLLPWANVLAGAGLLGGYFTQWGLAGPGHWIVIALLLGVVVIALAGAPTARWPVGLGAIALAALLVGMTWPYLFGVLGRSVGVWVVIAGALVLVVGGILDRGHRADPDGPPAG